MYVICTYTSSGLLCFFQGFTNIRREDFEVGGIIEAVFYNILDLAQKDLEQIRYLDPYDENWSILCLKASSL